ncbi:MAG: RluA family pseudouridine synthase, partial [Deltaproteobacteria bacterium]|nr:RluA family pseudouridine synthase [Deltaproteobacteria bacterium]MBW2530857.1 RluA family pseudouridine synthase [Deltaproteobacteria bacterium]
EQAGLLVVYKPAGWASEPTPRSSRSVVTELAAARGGGTVHAASRLDVGVSGLMLCSVDRSGARLVERLRRDRKIRRRYVALLAGRLPPQGSWTTALGRSRNGAGRVRSTATAAETKNARTDFVTVATASDVLPVSLVVLELFTGRLHQIRAHAATAQAPVLGDRRYGGPSSVALADGRVLAMDRLALHAAHLQVGDLLSVTAPPPPPLRDWWAHIGGEARAWTSAERRLESASRLDER